MTQSTLSQIEAAQDELILELDEVDFAGLKWMYRGIERNEIMENKQTLSKEEWINAVYELLVKYQGPAENDEQKANLRSWAESLTEGEDNCYSEGLTPEDAHWEEITSM